LRLTAGKGAGGRVQRLRRPQRTPERPAGLSWWSTAGCGAIRIGIRYPGRWRGMLGYSVANGLVVGPDGSADLDGKALKAAVSPFLCLRGMCSLVDDTVTNRQPCDVAEIPEGGTETTISAGVLGSNMSRLAGRPCRVAAERASSLNRWVESTRAPDSNCAEWHPLRESENHLARGKIRAQHDR
jgi:hypothetical protein